jgi:hypothetical protein
LANHHSANSRAHFRIDIPANGGYLDVGKLGSGFKGYDFDPITQQPRWVRQWRTAGTGTEHTIYRRGQIGPFMRFTISRLGKRTDEKLVSRSWIQHLYPKYPRLAA